MTGQAIFHYRSWRSSLKGRTDIHTHPYSLPLAGKGRPATRRDRVRVLDLISLTQNLKRPHLSNGGYEAPGYQLFAHRANKNRRT